MLHCHILPIKKYESLFKKPFDSKILDICKASRTSPFKRKMIDKDSVLKQGTMHYWTHSNGTPAGPGPEFS